ncbi:hypothetical protein FH972_003925 [Carpinus fangiana]|uniref:Uncharacterized protein n=1 Tax=Carpinus fangiana TaxID=176857 RepID=A0A5N6QK25_9ROSI|nr:hypothetical protein FH972_003925 [Carpinus fangiana]
MGTTETPQKNGRPPIVKLDMGLKLAEQWVNNMTKAGEDEPTEVESEARPKRLGLGAKVSRRAKVGPSNDPIERKLLAKLKVGKRKATKSAEVSIPFGRDGSDTEDEDDLESRTRAFDKKKISRF